MPDMRLKILFINPNQKRPSLPPIGLDYLYDATKAAGHLVEFFDFSLERPRDLRVAIEKQQPDIIGITVRNIDDVDIIRQQEFITPLKKWIKTIRKITAAKIVLGGIGFSFMPREIMQETGADFGIVGDGEATFPLLLKHLATPEKVPNTFYRKKCGEAEDILYTFQQSRSFNENATYSRSLIDNKLYYLQGNASNIQTIRGCNHNCIYCPEPNITGKVLRARSPKKVMEELKILLSKGIKKKIFFVDSEFNLNPEHSYGIAQAILDQGIQIEWTCTMMPGKFPLDLLTVMKKAGCSLVIWSIDSASEKMIRNLNKGFTLDDIYRASEHCDKIGLSYHHNLLFGGPGETLETIDETHRNIMRMNPDYIGVSAGIRIYPQTRLHQIALKTGELEESTNLLYPTYYKESYIKQTIWPYLIQKFGKIENGVLNGIRVNAATKSKLDEHFSLPSSNHLN